MGYGDTAAADNIDADENANKNKNKILFMR